MTATRIVPQDAPTLASDAELAAHEADTTSVHGIANTANLSTTSHVHAGADITSGTVADARIDAALARDSEVTTAVTTHEAAADPHVGYVREADADWVDLTDGGASTLHSHAATGAPADADYLVGTAHAGLSAEIVVGATPGGELGNTWASPTVDASHSGSTHAATQAAAEATAAGALTGHEADTSVHGIADTSVLATDAEVATAVSDHAAAANPHAVYLTQAEGDAAYEATGAVATHAGLADPHIGYRLESADHSHATTGLQAGTVAHTDLTSVGANDHHTQAHTHPAEGAVVVTHASTTGQTATDHHVAPAAGPDADVTVDVAGATGTASTFARSGHGHKVTTSAVAAAAVGTAAAGTSGTAPSRGDHVHPTGASTPSTQAFGDAAATGSGPAASMTDHKHAMPVNPVTAHEAAGDPHPTYLTAAEGDAAYQPVDSDLTAIAALTTTAFGRGLLALADAAALGANHSHSGATTTYAPGSFTVATGNYALMTKRLELTTSQRVTIEGTARLRID